MVEKEKKEMQTDKRKKNEKDRAMKSIDLWRKVKTKE